MDLNTKPLIQAKLKTAPRSPGVYIFRNASAEIIYVGKAVNLRNRSNSYFANYRRLDPRIQTMVDGAVDIEYITVASEVEALILETNLIKKYDPQYNILGTDDKNYLWIKIWSQMDFPIVTTVREKKDDKADYFGPFPNKAPVKRMLRKLRAVFPYRTCNRIIEVRQREDGSEYVYSSDTRPCLYYDLGLCSGPCTGKISRQEYRKTINDLKRFLRSEHSELKQSLRSEMEAAAKARDYEKAAELRDRLSDLEYITRFSLIDESVDDEALRTKTASSMLDGLKQLADKLELPLAAARQASADYADFRIECYDISNIQGTNATAAMVVSVGGKLQKDHYRKFKIKHKNTPDDFAMLQETLDRRMKYLLPATLNSQPRKANPSFEQKPDLIVIDGGKGQLSSVLQIMDRYRHEYNISIPVIGLAKREEEIFLPEYDDNGVLNFRLVKFNRRSPALRILQQVRDEAHRFGLGYHRLLRSKGMVYSQLDLIPGVGEVTRKKLILAFGSVAGIKKASLEDIQSVVKNKNTAFKIKKLLK